MNPADLARGVRRAGLLGVLLLATWCRIPAIAGGFIDEFDGAALGKDWERVNPDDERILVEGGKVVLVCRGPKNGGPANRLKLLRPLPKDFEAILELETPRQDGNWVMLDVVQDDKNKVEAWLTHHEGWQITRSHLRKTVAGEQNEVGDGECHKGLPARFRFQLRLRKEGRTWRSGLKAGQRDCKLEQTVLKLAPAYLEIYAANDAEGRKQMEVHLLRFELKELGK